MAPIARIDVGAKQRFYRDFLRRDQPAILTGSIEHWPALREWSFDYLEARAGDQEVLVSWLGDQEYHDGQGYVQQRTSRRTTLSAALRRIRAGENYYVDEAHLNALADLARDVGDLPFYPKLLARLALLPTVIWIGPAGTVSPAHYDPPHNLFVQVMGRKSITLFPSSQLGNLYLPSTLPRNNVSRVDIVHPDYERFPRFRDATPFEATLGPGDVLFLPRRWVHYIRAVDASISLSHCWHPWRDLPNAHWQRLRYEVRTLARRLRTRLRRSR